MRGATFATGQNQPLSHGLLGVALTVSDDAGPPSIVPGSGQCTCVGPAIPAHFEGCDHDSAIARLWPLVFLCAD